MTIHTTIPRVGSADRPQGQMVRPLSDQGVGGRASFVRRDFELDRVDGGETLRISALGLYRAFINGVRVGDDLLTPGWTSYQARLSYQTYDISSLLRSGTNQIEVWLGDGWYRSALGFPDAQVTNTWGEAVGVIADIRNAERILLATDTAWSSGLLPVMRNGIYFGEIYDAREERLSVTAGTQKVDGFDPETLVRHEVSGVKELPFLAPVGKSSDDEGRTIYDFGQNTAGYVELVVSGERGASVLVEHAEVVDQAGRFNNDNMRTAEVRLEYVLSGDGEEVYKPIFTFFGFRYARVTIVGNAEIKAIASIPITSATVRAGHFESGNPLVNRLVENTWWSLTSNFIEVPTDCPQRDERLGWTGDAQVFAKTACYLADSQAFLTKWIRDVIADQRPDGGIPHVSPDPYNQRPDVLPHFYGSTGWGDAICIVPWTLYEHYGDVDILREALPAMVRWSDYMWSLGEGGIARPQQDWSKPGFTFGDWLQPKGRSEKPFPTIGDDAAATIYNYISAATIEKVAVVLGEPTIIAKFQERAERIRAAFQEEFITSRGRLVYDDQTSYALAILNDLIPAHLLEAAGRNFRSAIERTGGRIGTGFIGTPAVLPALMKIGAPDLASDVFLQEDVPGWMYQVKQGATTIWERWDAIKSDGTLFDPAMTSYNHYSYGAVCGFLFEYVAGIAPDPVRPGFDHLLLRPQVLPRLGRIRACYQSKAGAVEAIVSVNGDKATYEVTIPDSATATFELASTYFDCEVDGVPTKAPAELKGGRHVITFRGSWR